MALTPYVTREMLNSYSTSDTGGTLNNSLYARRMVKDFIPIMSKLGTPMNDMVFKKGRGGTSKFVETPYGEGDINPSTTTLASGHSSASGTKTIVLSSNKLGKVNGLLKNMTTLETYRILGIDDVNYTVEAGFGATSPAAGTTGDKIQYLGPAIPEGATYTLDPITQGDREENYKQILEYAWSMSHRGKIRPTDEVDSDRFRHEQKKKMKEAALHIDSLLLWGTKNKGDGSGDNPSSFAGLVESTVANSIPVSGALELMDILDGLQTVAEDVGASSMGKTLLCGYDPKRIFISFFKEKRRYTGTGDISLTEDGFVCDFGHFKFKVNDRMADVARVILCNEDDWNYEYFEGGQWSDGMYSADGWFDIGFIRCDMGPIWPGDRRRAQWHSFSLTATDYPNLDLP